MKAGFIQFRPILGDLQSNMENLSKLIEQAAEADLIVIPELANSGYNFENREQAFQLAEKTGNSEFINFLTKKAREYNLHIVSGFNEKKGDKLFNTSVLINSNGLIGKYRKIHLFMSEFDIFEKGNLGLPVFDLGFCKMGMLVCFDWIFPELWRILALKGADLICHPSNLVLPYAQQAVPVHGMINKYFVITANRYGTERGVTFSGKSFISDPFGKTLITAKANEDAVEIIEIDISQSRNKMITDRNHALNDRFPEEYGELIR
ncbi:MAG: carbon-nitrogen hydrolase [Bacteroidetes bacterium]|nr:MAG: carbon-nitrogen hydrolase [Bacteroidota bacterium]